MKIGNAADPSRGRDHYVAVVKQVLEQIDVLRVAVHKPIAGMMVVGTTSLSILGEVVAPSHLLSLAQQLLDEVSHYEAGRASYADLHRPASAPRMFHISIT